MTYPVHLRWHDAEKTSVEWHGSPDGKRRVIDQKSARKYGLNPEIDDDWPYPGQIENDRRMAEFRAKMPGRVI